MARRQEFTRTTKLAAWDRSGGRCEQYNTVLHGAAVTFGCGKKLYPGDGNHFDHRIPCWAGGDNSLDNCVLHCTSCHSFKTKLEARVRAHSDKVRARHVGATTPKRKLPGGRDDKWKAKIGGGWERR